MNSDAVTLTWRLIIVCLTLLFAWLAYWDYRKKRLMFDERRVAIENGMEPPPMAQPAAAGWPGVKQQELQLKYAERRLRLEKGLDVPPESGETSWFTPGRTWTRLDYLRCGLFAGSLGLGLLVAALALTAVPMLSASDRSIAQAWCLVLGLLLLLYGTANIVYQRVLPEAPPDGGRREA